MKVYVGYDHREIAAYGVAISSMRRRTPSPLSVEPLILDKLGRFLTRPVEVRDGRLWCPISEAPMATEFAISRFCVPFICREGWALFTDCDVLCLNDLDYLFRLADNRYAVMVVKHQSGPRLLKVTYDERCEVLDGDREVCRVHTTGERRSFEQNTAIFRLVELLLEGKTHRAGEQPKGVMALELFPLKCSEMDWRGQFIVVGRDGKDLVCVTVMSNSAQDYTNIKALLEQPLKMDGQIQTSYSRKNWSSVVLWNCSHPAHERLTLAELNGWPGRDLHAFKWLDDSEIGELPRGWNYLVGVSPSMPAANVHMLHYTLGTPDMVPESPMADPWWRELNASRAVAS